jgi:hypothetical protein
MEPTNTLVLLSNRVIRMHMGIIKNAHIFLGPHMLSIDFVMNIPHDLFYPIIFGRPFITNLNIN